MSMGGANIPAGKVLVLHPNPDFFAHLSPNHFVDIEKENGWMFEVRRSDGKIFPENVKGIYASRAKVDWDEEMWSIT